MSLPEIDQEFLDKCAIAQCGSLGRFNADDAKKLIGRYGEWEIVCRGSNLKGQLLRAVPRTRRAELLIERGRVRKLKRHHPDVANSELTKIIRTARGIHYGLASVVLDVYVGNRELLSKTEIPDDVNAIQWVKQTLNGRQLSTQTANALVQLTLAMRKN